MNKIKFFIFVSFIVFAGFVFDIARAEAPEHNKDLDSKCPSGFQWSRGTAGCVQADCPSGAGRTYTYGCSCGEAWNKPFRTCYEKGLATSCVAKGAACPGDPGEKPSKPVSTPGKIESGQKPTNNCSVANRLLNFLPNKGFIVEFKRALKVEEKCEKPKPEESTTSADNGKPPTNACAKKFGDNFKLLNSNKNANNLSEKDCGCETGYERVAIAESLISTEKKSRCLDISRGALGLFKGTESEKIYEATDNLRGKNVGDYEVITVVMASGEEVKLVIIKNGPDSFIYTADGVNYSPSLQTIKFSEGALDIDGGSLIRRMLYNFSPYNWGSQNDLEKFISKLNERMVSGGTYINSVNRSGSLGYIKYHKEFIAGAAEYFKQREKGITIDQLLGSKEDSDVFIVQTTQRLTNGALPGDIFDQQTGVRRNLTEEEKEAERQRVKKELYTRYEELYARYSLNKKYFSK